MLTSDMSIQCTDMAAEENSIDAGVYTAALKYTERAEMCKKAKNSE